MPLELPDPELTDRLWADVLAARAAGSHATDEIDLYLAAFGLGVAATEDVARDVHDFASEQGYDDAVLVGPNTGMFLLVRGALTCQIIRGSTDAWGGVSDRWSYDSWNECVQAWILWKRKGRVGEEPNGWVRHQPSDRRREYSKVTGLVILEWTAP
jgi:hypothetical protein